MRGVRRAGVRARERLPRGQQAGIVVFVPAGYVIATATVGDKTVSGLRWSFITGAEAEAEQQTVLKAIDLMAMEFSNDKAMVALKDALLAD